MIALVFAALLQVSVAPEFVVGKSIPNIEVMDENGRVRNTSEWAGTPTIVAPLYSRCPLACPMIVRGLKRGIAETTTPPSKYRVVLFSFDPRDTAADLRRFRDRNNVPLNWSVVVARGNGARQLLDAIGYRYGDANGLYVHPNAVMVLTSDLKTAKFLFGTNYDARTLDEALAIAGGRRDWIGNYGGILLAGLLLIALLAAVYLVNSLTPAASLRNEKT